MLERSPDEQKLELSDEEVLEARAKASPKTSWYSKLGTFSIFYSGGLLISYCLFGAFATEFVVTGMVQLIIPTAALVGTHLSSFTYFGLELDLTARKKSRWSSEQIGTLLGILAGVAVGVTLFALRLTAGVFTGSPFEILQAFGTLFACVGSFTGLAHRLSLNYEEEALPETGFKRILNAIKKDKQSIVFGAIFGLTSGLVLWFLGASAMTMVVGVTSFLTGGAAIPFWLTGGLFVLSYTSSSVASFDYVARAYRFLTSTKQSLMDADQYHQLRGAVIGVLTGLVVASLAIALLVTPPFLPALIASVAIIIVCTSVLGGLCARFGRMIDEHLKKNKTIAEVIPSALTAVENQEPNPPSLEHEKKAEQIPLLEPETNPEKSSPSSEHEMKAEENSEEIRNLLDGKLITQAELIATTPVEKKSDNSNMIVLNLLPEINTEVSLVTNIETIIESSDKSAKVETDISTSKEKQPTGTDELSETLKKPPFPNCG